MQQHNDERGRWNRARMLLLVLTWERGSNALPSRAYESARRGVIMGSRHPGPLVSARRGEGGGCVSKLLGGPVSQSGSVREMTDITCSYHQYFIFLLLIFYGVKIIISCLKLLAHAKLLCAHLLCLYIHMILSFVHPNLSFVFLFFLYPLF